MAEAIELPLFFVGAEETPIFFANLMVVQHQDREFILTFGQYSPPLVLGSGEKALEQIKNLPYVPIKVVARIGMTAERLKEVIQVLQENYNTFQERGGEEG